LGQEMNAMSSKLSDASARLVAETAARVHAMQQLRHAERLVTVGKLASGIAHELGTPLNVVSGRAKMIVQNPAADAGVRNNARIVMEQSERMAQIIRQLLDFARAGKPNKSLVDLRHLAASSLSLLTPIADKRRVTLKFEASEPVSEVVADAAQLQQVVTNLVVNAVQASAESSTVEVGLRTARGPAKPGSESSAEPERGFVAQQLRRCAHRAQERVLRPGRPPGQHHAVEAQAVDDRPRALERRNEHVERAEDRAGPEVQRPVVA